MNEPAAEPVAEPSSEPSADTGAWRGDWAGEDTAKAEYIGRYASPNAAMDGGYAANLKIASGDYKKVEAFPDKGTPEERAAWRESNGTPESAEHYGFEVNDKNRDTIKSLTENAFANNQKASDAQVTLKWHQEQNQARRDAQIDSDNALKTSTEDLLRNEWGDDYRVNINRIHGFLDTAPEGVKQQIMGARLENGAPLASDPNALKWLIDMALMANPATTLVPPGGTVESSIVDEMQTLENMMGNTESEYWKGAKAETNQARYRELLVAQESKK